MSPLSRFALSLILVTFTAATPACAATEGTAELAGTSDNTSANDSAGTAGVETTTETAGERLIAQPPRGWRQTGATSISTLRRAEFMPEDELATGSETDWVRRITFESLKEDPLPDPLEFVELMSMGRDYDCGTFRSHPTFAGEENGYPTAVFLQVCHKDRQTDRSEVTLMKAIQGNDYFYVITRSMRGDPIPKDGAPDIEEAEIGGWAVYLKSITVCDASRPEAHPCPPAG